MSVFEETHGDNIIYCLTRALQRSDVGVTWDFILMALPQHLTMTPLDVPFLQKLIKYLSYLSEEESHFCLYYSKYLEIMRQVVTRCHFSDLQASNLLSAVFMDPMSARTVVDYCDVLVQENRASFFAIILRDAYEKKKDYFLEYLMEIGFFTVIMPSVTINDWDDHSFWHGHEELIASLKDVMSYDRGFYHLIKQMPLEINMRNLLF